MNIAADRRLELLDFDASERPSCAANAPTRTITTRRPLGAGEILEADPPTASIPATS